MLIVNPPYGKRLGDEDELKELYCQIGDIMKKRCRGWTGYVLTGNLELAKYIGLKASRRFVLFNGAIECRLLRYELYWGCLFPDRLRGGPSQLRVDCAQPLQ